MVIFLNDVYCSGTVNVSRSIDHGSSILRDFIFIGNLSLPFGAQEAVVGSCVQSKILLFLGPFYSQGQFYSEIALGSLMTRFLLCHC